MPTQACTVVPVVTYDSSRAGTHRGAGLASVEEDGLRGVLDLQVAATAANEVASMHRRMQQRCCPTSVAPLATWPAVSGSQHWQQHGSDDLPPCPGRRPSHSAHSRLSQILHVPQVGYSINRTLGNSSGQIGSGACCTGPACSLETSSKSHLFHLPYNCRRFATLHACFLRQLLAVDSAYDSVRAVYSKLQAIT